MKIAGLQKLSLIDYPDKIACTLFIYGCNFKCGFCHNPELVLAPDSKRKDYSEKEILEFLEKRKNQLEGVCITGGEPLMTLDLNFMKKIKELGYLVKIDTNGCFPEKLKKLIDENLVDFVSMDVKSSKEKYNSITNSEVDLEKIEKSIELVGELENYEFRTTIVKGIHDAEEVKKIAVWLNKIIGKPLKFCLQGFKNKGKVIENIYKMKKDTPKEFLKELKDSIKDYFEYVEIRV